MRQENNLRLIRSAKLVSISCGRSAPKRKTKYIPRISGDPAGYQNK